MPSERTYPLAELSKLLQRPSGDNIPALLVAIVNSGLRHAFAPPTTAISISPLRMA